MDLFVYRHRHAKENPAEAGVLVTSMKPTTQVQVKLCKGRHKDTPGVTATDTYF